MDGFDLPLFEKGHVFGWNLQGIAFPDCAHRAFRMRAPSPVARRVEQNRAPRERPVRIEDHLDLRDIRVAVRHAWRRRPAIEVTLCQPRVERRRHRHRHVRRVVVRQPLGCRKPRLGRGGCRCLALSDELGDRVRVKIVRRLWFLRRRVLRSFRRGSTNFGRTGGSTAASWMASFGGGGCGSGRSVAEASVRAPCPPWLRAGVGGGVSAFGGVGARSALGGCGWGVACGGVGSAEARRSGGGSGGAGADAERAWRPSRRS